ncbi:Uncharacterised protein [Bartonella grahamii]|uniref:Uncharacterized protein n=1 Tax=Bartonella grahamii TaxID=33045 RepID=A0A336NB74_BARGR|nr:Uncharacterised protein [Bartonella grahamii]
MFQNHKNNNKNSNEISYSYSKTSQHHPYSSHHKSARPTRLISCTQRNTNALQPLCIHPAFFQQKTHCLSCQRVPSSMPLANSYQRSSFRNFQQRSYPSNNALQPFSIHLLFLEQHPSSNYRPCQKGYRLPEH